MLEVDPYTDEIYMATSSYTTNSALYVISASGQLKKKFADAGGVNVSSAAFVQQLHFGDVTIY
jgi:hypothetical protein